MTEKPIANSPDLVRNVTGHLLSRRVHLDQVGEIIAAPCGWSVATVDESGRVTYVGVIAFVIGSNGMRRPVTAVPYDEAYSAVHDPASGAFVAIVDGKVFPDQASLVQGMLAARQFAKSTMAETTAH